MIIEFSVENHKSIAEMQTLSLVAAPLKSLNPTLQKSNVIKVDDHLSLLKTVALYGANGSGKSNMVNAMVTMLHIIFQSMSDETVIESRIRPFALIDPLRKKPTFFQLQFICEGQKYRYGFEATRSSIVSEWLAGPAKENETYYFQRAGQEIQINKTRFSEGKDLESKTAETNLFLNVVAAFNGPIAKAIKKYLRGIYALGSVNDKYFRQYTLDSLNDPVLGKEVLYFLRSGDTGIEQVREEILSDEERNSKARIFSIRTIIDGQGEKVGEIEFDFDEFESAGTKKMFNLAGALLRKLREGGLFIIDEFDARFHPMLTRRIVEMFNSTKLNPGNAQLFFVTHDTNLLDRDLLRRDQIYFAEKDIVGRTSFYSMYDFKGVRNDASFEKNYLKGKFGAIPDLQDLDDFLDVE
ncbi:MAG: ATP-binding protein [Bacteroidota bacterium]